MRAFPPARARGVLAAVLAAVLLASPAPAQQPSECEAPDHLTHAEGKLPHVAAAVANDKRLDILVLGTGSSALSGPAGAAAAFPARLEAALRSRLPQVAVSVRTEIAPRRTAADMLGPLGNAMAAGKPSLVIWQTGTVDAMRGIDPEEFRAKLETGAEQIRAAGADAVLMNMQYSPRTESMIAAGAYLDAIRLIAQQNDYPLFDRLAVMKHWSETGTFEFTDPDQKQLAERVHGCIGNLLAEMIIDAAGLGGQPSSKDRF